MELEKEIKQLGEALISLSLYASITYAVMASIGVYLVFKYARAKENRVLIGSSIFTFFMLMFSSYLFLLADGPEESSDNTEAIFQSLLVAYGFLVSFYDFKTYDIQADEHKFSMLGYMSVCIFLFTFGGEFYRNRVESDYKERRREQLQREQLIRVQEKVSQQIEMQQKTMHNEIADLDTLINTSQEKIDKIHYRSQILRSLANQNNSLILSGHYLIKTSDSLQQLKQTQIMERASQTNENIADLAIGATEQFIQTFDTLGYYANENARNFSTTLDTINFYASESSRNLSQAIDTMGDYVQSNSVQLSSAMKNLEKSTSGNSRLLKNFGDSLYRLQQSDHQKLIDIESKVDRLDKQSNSIDQNWIIGQMKAVIQAEQERKLFNDILRLVQSQSDTLVRDDLVEKLKALNGN